ncbi:helix-turn-helix domain-containing protein [Clostridium arbusti]|uniref:helix-turn-helix domain-containing protein n=1 Tax=Clostridium arbusti TaxID=1137848 RepID=UPI000288EA3B|nr:helix-turn-helix transcriptional regulator [Clostridium arbusti]
MFKIKISDLLGKYKKTQLWLCEETGIRPATISNYYHEKIVRINKDDLEKIYNLFKTIDPNLKTTDMIEFVDDDVL